MGFNGVVTVTFQDFTASMAPLWHAYLRHPWMVAIHDGSLTREQFAFFLVQDMPYQRDFLQALVLAATKSSDPDLLLQWRRFIVEEAEFEAELLAELGTRWTFDRWAAGPARDGYMNHLIRVAHEGSIGEICASLLPCAAGFTGAMAEPADKTGLDPLYTRWLEYYERPEQFAFSSALVGTFEASMAGASEDEALRAKMICTRSVQHQIAVLDAAWRTSDEWWTGG